MCAWLVIAQNGASSGISHQCTGDSRRSRRPERVRVARRARRRAGSMSGVPSVIAAAAAAALTPRAAARVALQRLADELRVLGVDLAQLLDRGVGDVGADHLVGLAAQLLHVDPRRVGRLGAVGDDAGLEERLDQHAEDVRALAHHAAAVGVGERLHHRAAHPLPVEAELRVDRLLLLGVHEVEEQRLEALRRPVLDLARAPPR